MTVKGFKEENWRHYTVADGTYTMSRALDFLRFFTIEQRLLLRKPADLRDGSASVMRYRVF